MPHPHSAPWRLTPPSGGHAKSLTSASHQVSRAGRAAGLPGAPQLPPAAAASAASCLRRRPLSRGGRAAGAPGALPAGTAGMGGGKGSEEERKEAMLHEYATMRAAAFPQVPEMECQELLKALQASQGGGGGKRTVVVDTRSEAECEVSMIPGGVLRQGDFERCRDEFKDCTVVCYCTIGLRSGKYAESLRAKAGLDAYNLKGSILAWTHERLPLTASYDPTTGSAALPLPPPGGPLPAAEDGTGTEGQTTSRIHVYSDKFALQADGFEPVTFPSSPMAFIGSLLPTWIIAKMASTGR